MEFKGELINGDLVVKPIIERNGNNVTVHVPSFKTISKTIQEIKDGKRSL